MRARLTVHLLARRRALRSEALTWLTPRVSTRTRGDLTYDQAAVVDGFKSKTDVKKFRLNGSKWIKPEIYSASRNGLVAGSPKVLVLRQAVTQFYSAVNKGKVSDELDCVMSLFWELAKDKKLGTGEVNEVARMLNNATRLKNALDSSAEASQALQRYVRDFRRLYMKGELSRHEMVPLFLIAMYENLQQHQSCFEISKWALQQDVDQITPPAVGIILKTVAIHDNTMERCEELYSDALKYLRFRFDPYDLSHNAIPPDRSKHVQAFGGWFLLRPMIKSRLTHGDWRNAYLALDTAFRNYAYHIDQNILDSFVRFRPLHESYQIFMMFARTGAVIRGRDLMKLLAQLNSAQKVGGNLDLNLDIARAMFHLLQAYLASGGKMDSRHLDHLMKGILSLLDRRPTTISRELSTIRDLECQLVWKLLNQSIDFFRNGGCPLVLANYATLITMSGNLRESTLLSLAMRDFKKAGLSANASFWECLLAAAGDLQRPDLVCAAWTKISQHAVTHDYALELRTWRALAQSAKETGLKTYVLDQVDRFYHKVDEYMYREILKALRKRAPWEDQYQSISSTTPYNVRWQRMRSIRKFCEEMGVLLSTIEKRLFVKPFSFPHISIWDWPNRPNEQWQRELYDEISLSSSANVWGAQSTSKPTWSNNDRVYGKKSTTSPTGYSLGQLRYLNTKSINDLLIQAEIWESKKHQSQSSAEIRKNLIVNERGLESSLQRPKHWKQIIAHRIDLEEEKSKKLTEEHWRARIFNLRGPKYRLPPSLR